MTGGQNYPKYVDCSMEWRLREGGLSDKSTGTEMSWNILPAKREQLSVSPEGGGGVQSQQSKGSTNLCL